MKKITLFILFFCIGSSLFGQKKKLKKKWIQADLEEFIKITEFLSEGEFDLNTLEKKFKFLPQDEQIIWYKFKKRTGYQSGYYLSKRISFLSIDSVIFKLRVRMNDRGTEILNSIRFENHQINAVLASHWKVVKEWDRYSNNWVEVYQLEFENNILIHKFENEIAKKLGDLEKIKLNNRTEGFYLILMDPLETYDYGYACYADGREPLGRIAIKRLFKSKRWDLIRNVVKGYNLEGRAYGVEALLTGIESEKYSLREVDKITLSQLMNSHLYVKECRGCFVGEYEYRTLFGNLKFD